MVRYPNQNQPKPNKAPVVKLDTGSASRSKAGDRREPVTLIIREGFTGLLTLTPNPANLGDLATFTDPANLAGTVFYDPYSMWRTNTSAFIPPVTGSYRITFQCKVVAVRTGAGDPIFNFNLYLTQNSDTVAIIGRLFSGFRSTTAGVGGYLELTTIFYTHLTAGLPYTLYCKAIDTIPMAESIKSASLEVTLLR